jgi:hypothetical protein
VLIAVTFGNQSDWLRNVLAAGCTIRIEGEDYAVSRPQFLTRQEAKPLVAATFGPMERAGFRMLGIRQLMRLDVAPAGS